MARSPLAGVFCVEKPAGVTSRHVVDETSKLVRSGRVGHAGTLDPLATGVLVVCVGWATRLVPLVQQQPKRYRAVFELGATSDTDDRTGVVVPTPDAPVPTLEEIENLLPKYTGTILQVPPIYSAVKIAGERSYDLARQGEIADLQPRPVDVHSLRLLDYQHPRLELEMECGSGTYVRAIGRDLGRDLGCGAIMTDLIRTAIGGFTLETAIPLSALDRQSWRTHLRPPLAIVDHFSRFTCGDIELDLLSRGCVLMIDESVSIPGTDVALISQAGELVAVGEFDPTARRIQPRTVFPDAIKFARSVTGSTGGR